MASHVATGGGGTGLREQLNRLFATQLDNVTAAQRLSVRRWQSPDDRFYQYVQTAIQGGVIEDDAAANVAVDLDRLMSTLPEGVQVWRGLRNSQAAFGVPRDNLESIVNVPLEQQRFTATSGAREVAMAEFTRPGPSPVLCLMSARAGCPVLWVPPVGAEEYAYQQELLFAPGVILRILGVDRAHDLPVVEMEVTAGHG